MEILQIPNEKCVKDPTIKVIMRWGGKKLHFVYVNIFPLLTGAGALCVYMSN